MAVLSRIPPRIADDPGSEQLIITGIVGMAVNPKCRLILVNQAFEAARECRVQGIVRVARRNGLQRRQMMRDNNGRAVESLLELALEPCPARLVKHDRILRPKRVPALSDAEEVVHGLPGAFAGKPGFTFPVQLEVSPKRAAKEADAVQNQNIVTQ